MGPRSDASGQKGRRSQMQSRLLEWDKTWTQASRERVRVSRTGSPRTPRPPLVENTELVRRPVINQGLEHAFHEKFHAITRWYQDWLIRWASGKAANEEGEGYQTTTTGTASSGSAQPPRRETNKRKRQNRKGDSSKDDEDGRDSEDKSQTTGNSSDSELRLACPFYKRNPARYVSHQYCLHHWPNTHRLKEHLYRQHAISDIQCSQCGTLFTIQSSIQSSFREFQDHRCRARAGDQRDFELLEGLDPYMKEKIQNKGFCRDGSEVSKWHAIYAVLFPNDNPSDYPDPHYYTFLESRQQARQQARQQVTTFLLGEMSSIIRNAFNMVGHTNGTTTQDPTTLHAALMQGIGSCVNRFGLEATRLTVNRDAGTSVNHADLGPPQSDQGTRTISPSQDRGSQESSTGRKHSTTEYPAQHHAGLEHEPITTAAPGPFPDPISDYPAQAWEADLAWQYQQGLENNPDFAAQLEHEFDQLLNYDSQFAE
ncbi:hypothetical protein GGR51DRAFT_567221 [Nemania sp. FL0031]|nr:hypothetical protein GGR51DRAFT_567221 [Nemania sp. FL0031]